MVDGDDKNVDNNPESTESLRNEFGLPPLKTEQDGPPVDMSLITALVTNGSVSERDHEKVMDYISRFQDWRNAYTRAVIEDYQRKKSGASPDSPSLESS